MKPRHYVVNATDLTAFTAGNLMFKYADAAYIVIPAARSGVNWNWIVQTGGRKTTI